MMEMMMIVTKTMMMMGMVIVMMIMMGMEMAMITSHLQRFWINWFGMRFRQQY